MSGLNKTIQDESIERARYLQSVHAWPLSDKINYEGWLSNFENTEDQNIACLILDFFTYFSEAMVNSLFSYTIGSCGHILKSKFLDWQH
ncbi:MAG: hypothetical protein AAF901_04245, partial [Bacteroidota bacterium]